jgi:hypothetical protein
VSQPAALKTFTISSVTNFPPTEPTWCGTDESSLMFSPTLVALNCASKNFSFLISFSLDLKPNKFDWAFKFVIVRLNRERMINFFFHVYA